MREATRLFKLFTDLEVQRHTPVEAMLARMPRPFVDALRAGIRRLLDARKARRRPKGNPDHEGEAPLCD